MTGNRKSIGSHCLSMKRWVSLIVIITLIGSYHFAMPPLGYSADQLPVLANAVIRVFPDDLSQIKVPAKIGKIQAVFKSSGRDVVILIQDAHAIPDAQLSIQQLINYFQTTYGIRRVALEGASSELDPQIFKSFPDQPLLKKVLRQYHENGEFSAGTASAIFNKTDCVYQGIENWDLYEEGLTFYLQAMQKEPEIVQKLTALKARISALKPKLYSKKLLEVDLALEEFYGHYGNLLAVLSKLSQIKKPREGTELRLILDESKRQGAGEKDVESEVKTIAAKVKKDLEAKSRDDDLQKLTVFNKEYQEFVTSKISPQSFALFLRELAIQYRIPVKVSKQLQVLMRNQNSMRDIQGTKLFDDFQTYADDVVSSLMRNDEESGLNRLNRRLHLFDRLAKLEFNHADWEEFRMLMKELADRAQTQAEIAGTQSVAAIAEISQMEEELAALIRACERHVEFYINAGKRDQALFENLMKLMEEKLADNVQRIADKENSSQTHMPGTQDDKPNASILVAGGFHTEGLTRLFRERGVSFVLLMPAMASIPAETHYRAQMKGNVSWRGYFEIENGKVDLNKAFVRGTRDKILKESGEETGKVLKFWRDQVVRDLAQQNRITKVRNYTDMIDEVVGIREADQWQNKVIDDARKFADGVRELQAKGELNQQKILELLKPASVPPEAVNNQCAAVAESGLMALLLRGETPPEVDILGYAGDVFTDDVLHTLFGGRAGMRPGVSARVEVPAIPAPTRAEPIPSAVEPGTPGQRSETRAESDQAGTPGDQQPQQQTRRRMLQYSLWWLVGAAPLAEGIILSSIEMKKRLNQARDMVMREAFYNPDAERFWQIRERGAENFAAGIGLDWERIHKLLPGPFFYEWFRSSIRGQLLQILDEPQTRFNTQNKNRAVTLLVLLNDPTITDELVRRLEAKPRAGTLAFGLEPPEGQLPSNRSVRSAAAWAVGWMLQRSERPNPRAVDCLVNVLLMNDVTGRQSFLDERGAVNHELLENATAMRSVWTALAASEYDRRMMERGYAAEGLAASLGPASPQRVRGAFDLLLAPQVHYASERDGGGRIDNFVLHDQSVREHAMEGLLANPRVDQTVDYLAAISKDPGIRDGGTKAVEKLLEIAKSSNVPQEIRVKAVQGILEGLSWNHDAADRALTDLKRNYQPLVTLARNAPAVRSETRAGVDKYEVLFLTKGFDEANWRSSGRTVAEVFGGGIGGPIRHTASLLADWIEKGEGTSGFVKALRKFAFSDLRRRVNQGLLSRSETRPTPERARQLQVLEAGVRNAWARAVRRDPAAMTHPFEPLAQDTYQNILSLLDATPVFESDFPNLSIEVAGPILSAYLYRRGQYERVLEYFDWVLSLPPSPENTGRMENVVLNPSFVFLLFVASFIDMNSIESARRERIVPIEYVLTRLDAYVDQLPADDRDSTRFQLGTFLNQLAPAAVASIFAMMRLHLQRASQSEASGRSDDAESALQEVARIIWCIQEISRLEGDVGAFRDRIDHEQLQQLLGRRMAEIMRRVDELRNRSESRRPVRVDEVRDILVQGIRASSIGGEPLVITPVGTPVQVRLQSLAQSILDKIEARRRKGLDRDAIRRIVHQVLEPSPTQRALRANVGPVTDKVTDGLWKRIERGAQRPSRPVGESNLSRLLIAPPAVPDVANAPTVNDLSGLFGSIIVNEGMNVFVPGTETT
ncbi:MAG: hypothetical protein PHN49_10620, partial [Candidatus Omnitrophica bacterium]|nr:hypothetical protein [Candidatus Omnitrophota bacterium]